MAFRHSRDYDIERPNSDFPDYKGYFEEYEEYKEPCEWDLYDDDELRGEVFLDDDLDEF